MTENSLNELMSQVSRLDDDVLALTLMISKAETAAVHTGKILALRVPQKGAPMETGKHLEEIERLIKRAQKAVAEDHPNQATMALRLIYEELSPAIMALTTKARKRLFDEEAA